MEWTIEQRELPPLDVTGEERTEAEAALDSYDDDPDDRKAAHAADLAALACRERQLTAALSEIERLKSEQMGELAVGKWISVKDRKPKHEQEVLIFPRAGGTTAFYGTRWSDRPAFYMYGAVLHEVTHWQPLPAPPSGEQAAPVGKTRCPYCGWPDEPKNEADKRCEGCGWPVKDMPAGFHAMHCPTAAPVEVQAPKGEV